MYIGDSALKAVECKNVLDLYISVCGVDEEKENNTNNNNNSDLKK